MAEFDRGALIMYLKEVRDLEYAKARLQMMYSKEESDYQSRRNIKYPAYEKESYISKGKEQSTMVFHLLDHPISVGLAVLIFLASVSFIDIEAHGGVEIFAVFFWIFIFLIPTIFDYIATSKHNKKVEKFNRELEEKYQLQIAEEKKRVSKVNEENRKKIMEIDKKMVEIDKQWYPVRQYYENEIDKVDSLLQGYYSQNILPMQFRNIANVSYIYDYMSTSYQSLTDCLFHSHLEEAVQKILASLGRIIAQNSQMIMQQRRLEAQNAALINNNNQMLKQLANVEQQSMLANEYNQMAVNYAKANAYFSEATYQTTKQVQEQYFPDKYVHKW